MMGVIIIIIAAALLELISAIQYYYSRDLLEKALERRAESELTMKAILIKSTLRNVENTVRNHVWDMKRNINEPDSMFDAARWLITDNNLVVGGGIAFVPDRFPQKGRLFEPWAFKRDGEIYVKQLAGPDHDYTRMDFFSKPFENDTCYWSKPYLDEVGTGEMISSFAIPIHDEKRDIIAVMGVDMSLEWLGDTLNLRHIYPSSFVLLMNYDGSLISTPPEDHPKYGDIPQVVQLVNDSIVDRESENKRCNVVDFTGIDGKGGEVIYAHLKGEPRWQLAVVCYDDEVYGDLDKMQLHILILSLLGLLVLAFILRQYHMNNRRLIEVGTERERIESELHIARGIQHEMLPAAATAATHHDIDVTGFLKPAREVGGDLYDYLIRDEKLFFCIGDVSGKGVPSALLMAVVHSLFRNEAGRENNPKTIMETLNRYAAEGNESSMFVTIFIGVLDLPTGRMRYCNAGHDTPLLITPDSVEQLPVEANLPIGLFNDFGYTVQEYRLQAGETLFLYTDGLTEARNKDRNLLGLPRVKRILDDSRNATSQQIIDNVVNAVTTYADGAEQSDDLTLLALTYTPHDERNVLDTDLTISNNVGEVKTLNAFVIDVAERLSLDKTTTHNVKLAVEEAVVNVIDYAYPIGTNGKIHIAARADDSTLRVIITDNGAAFDPTEALKTDTSLSVEDRPIGGLGILLVRQLMDAINYERIEGKNILTLIKNYKKTIDL